MNKEKDGKKKEEAYMMLQMIDAQIKELDRELRSIDAKRNELIRLKDSLDALKKMKTKIKSYSLIGSGVYAESELNKTDSVLVNVGADVFIEKDVGDAKKLIEGQIKETDSIALQLNQNLQVLGARAQEIQQDLVKNV